MGSTSVDKTNQSTGADVDLVLLVVDDFGIVFVTMYHVYCGLFVGSNSRFRCYDVVIPIRVLFHDAIRASRTSTTF